MERPTSALHLTRVALSLRQLGAEPHTKEVGRDEVYNHHCFRSACSDDGSRRAVTGSADASPARADVGYSDDCALPRARASRAPGAVLLRSRPVWLRTAARADRARRAVC